MNIAMRKLALLEQNLKEKEELARLEGYASYPNQDNDLRKRINDLMDKIRYI